jgi:hypothetical protein
MLFCELFKCGRWPSRFSMDAINVAGWTDEFNERFLHVYETLRWEMRLVRIFIMLRPTLPTGENTRI